MVVVLEPTVALPCLVPRSSNLEASPAPSAARVLAATRGPSPAAQLHLGRMARCAALLSQRSRVRSGVRRVSSMCCLGWRWWGGLGAQGWVRWDAADDQAQVTTASAAVGAQRCCRAALLLDVQEVHAVFRALQEQL